MNRTVLAKLTIEGKLWTTNGERSAKTWVSRAAATRHWREAAYYEARRRYVGQINPAIIHIQPVQRVGKLADTAAHNPVAKAVIDGLVDAKVLIDDDPKHLFEIVFHAPRRGETEGMVITIIQATPEKEGEK